MRNVELPSKLPKKTFFEALQERLNETGDVWDDRWYSTKVKREFKAGRLVLIVVRRKRPTVHFWDPGTPYRIFSGMLDV